MQARSFQPYANGHTSDLLWPDDNWGRRLTEVLLETVAITLAPARLASWGDHSDTAGSVASGALCQKRSGGAIR